MSEVRDDGGDLDPGTAVEMMTNVWVVDIF